MTVNFIPAKARVLDLLRDDGRETLTLSIHEDRLAISKILREEEVYERVYSNVYLSDAVPVCYSAVRGLEREVVSIKANGKGPADLGYGYVEDKVRKAASEHLAVLEGAYKIIPIVDSETREEIGREYGKKVYWMTPPLIFLGRGSAESIGIEDDEGLVIKGGTLWSTGAGGGGTNL